MSTPPRRRRIVLRATTPRMSLRLDRRTLLVLATTLLALLAAVLVTLTVGEYTVPLDHVWAALGGHASPADQLVITTLRLPRVLAAVFVGAALGTSGAIFQAIAGNPLVAPDIIGVNTGAAVAVVAAVVLGHATQPPALYSFAGAVAVALAVYLLSLRSGLSRLRMVLIGIGVNAALGAVITYLLTRANLDQAEDLTQYLLGDVSAATWPTLVTLAPATVVLLLAAIALGPQLVALELGDDLATAIGARVTRSRLLVLAVATALAAVAVAAAGPVGFVAFIAPHIARRLTRNTGAGVLPVSGAVAALLVVAADYAAQRLLEPTQLPVGILTVLIGGPYFMTLLVRASRAGLAN